MGKISPAQRAEFAEKSKDIKSNIDVLDKKIMGLQKDIAKNKNTTVNYKKIQIANFLMNTVNLYLKLSSISMKIMGIKNESYLEKARKITYKYISILEEIVGDEVDVPLSENEELLASIEQISDEYRIKLVRKIASVIKKVEERFGPNSKWKWSFVDLESRAATLCKNLTDFKKIQRDQDPRIEGFAERNEILVFIREYMRGAANRLREKYEMASNEAIDMKTAVHLLESLRRISSLFKDSQDTENLKKNIKIWEGKMEKDELVKDEKKKKEMADDKNKKSKKSKK
jgi:hypothetical protein